MGAPVQEFDGRKPSKSVPSKNAPAKDTSTNIDAVSSSCATEAPAPPWKRKRERDVFEGDVAVVELRSRLALGVERIPEPEVLFSTAPAFSGIFWLMSGVAMAAAAAGVAGYLSGFTLSAETPEPSPAAGHADVLPSLATPAANPKTSNRDFDPPAAARPVSIGLAPVERRSAANPATPVDAAQQPALLPSPQAVSPPVAPQPSATAADAPVIAAKMRIGVELVTYGEVTAARKMFERVAEAGEAAGAFALAETYDPLVLGQLHLRERIVPDVALARTWYERARDLGSLEARDRISRLAQLPQ
jgi:hypothetical protein